MVHPKCCPKIESSKCSFNLLYIYIDVDIWEKEWLRFVNESLQKSKLQAGYRPSLKRIFFLILALMSTDTLENNGNVEFLSSRLREDNEKRMSIQLDADPLTNLTGNKQVP